MKRLVLLGGGHAHVEVLRELALAKPEGWEVALVSPSPRQLYSGMIPGYIAGHYGLDECAIDLQVLCRRAGVALRRARAALVSPSEREVMLADGDKIAYDLLSIDIGSQSAAGNASGVDRHAIAVRPLDNLVAGWARVLKEARLWKAHSVTVVGGGAAGVELALAMEYRLRTELGERAPHVRVIGDTPVIVPEFSAGARYRLQDFLMQRSIGAHLGSAVTEVGEKVVRLASELEFVSDATFWVTGSAAPDLVRDSGFATDAKGYLLTDECLRSVSHADVFAVGDCASRQDDPLPKAGVFAVRAAPILAANLRAAMTGAALQLHKTSRRYLALVSAGSQDAVGIWNGISFKGAWAWRWKDRIDRRFVARYR